MFGFMMQRHRAKDKMCQTRGGRRGLGAGKVLSWAAYVAGLVIMHELGLRYLHGISLLLSSAVPKAKGVSPQPLWCYIIASGRICSWVSLTSITFHLMSVITYKSCCCPCIHLICNMTYVSWQHELHWEYRFYIVWALCDRTYSTLIGVHPVQLNGFADHWCVQS